MNKKLISIIIPAYQPDEKVLTTINGLVEAGYNDILVVDDGSNESCNDIFKTVEQMQECTLLSHLVNKGKGAALKTAIEYFVANRKDKAAVVTVDADGQHLPQYIAPMLEKMQEGYDIVIGSRFVNEKKPKSLRMLGSNMISLAMRITTGRKVNDPTSGMRMFNKKMIEEFALNMNYGPEPDTVSYLLKQGATIAEVQVQMEERIAGASYLTMGRSMMYMMRMLISILLIQNFRKRQKVKKIVVEEV